MSKAKMSRAHKCTAKTKSGRACGMPPLEGRPFCWNHDPEKAKERAAARRKGGENRRRPATPAEDADLRTMDGIQDALGVALQDALTLDASPARVRCVVAVLGLAMKALEVGDHEERLAAVEALLERDHKPRNWRTTA